jgi:hypothetical protein
MVLVRSVLGLDCTVFLYWWLFKSHRWSNRGFDLDVPYLCLHEAKQGEMQPTQYQAPAGTALV